MVEVIDTSFVPSLVRRIGFDKTVVGIGLEDFELLFLFITHDIFLLHSAK